MGKLSRIHIESRMLWLYVQGETELTSEEHQHLSDCEHCLSIFRLCILSDTIEQVEEQLMEDWRQSA